MMFPHKLLWGMLYATAIITSATHTQAQLEDSWPTAHELSAATQYPSLEHNVTMRVMPPFDPAKLGAWQHEQLPPETRQLVDQILNVQEAYKVAHGERAWPPASEKHLADFINHLEHTLINIMNRVNPGIAFKIFQMIPQNGMIQVTFIQGAHRQRIHKNIGTFKQHEIRGRLPESLKQKIDALQQHHRHNVAADQIFAQDPLRMLAARRAEGALRPRIANANPLPAIAEAEEDHRKRSRALTLGDPKSPASSRRKGTH